MEMEVNRATAFPVHEAARRGDVEDLQSLLRLGYSVNWTDYDRCTPLHEACSAGKVEAVQFLLDNDALVNAWNIDGSTPLCQACASGKSECVRLLLGRGAEENPVLFHGTSPLHEAAVRGHTDCVKLMLDAGALVNKTDTHFGTPLHAACIHPSPNISCVKAILDGGANVNAVRIHATALHEASRNGNTDLVGLLLAYGADPCQRDNQNRLPRDLCSKDSASWNLLLDAECNVPTLQHLCRLRLRDVFPCSLLASISSLPRSLLRYLLYEEYSQSCVSAASGGVRDFFFPSRTGACF